MQTIIAGLIEFTLFDSYLFLMLLVAFIGTVFLVLYFVVGALRHAGVELFAARKKDSKFSFFAGISVLLIIAGISLLGHFSLSGGPNSGKVLVMSDNLYFELHFGMVLILLGMAASLLSAKK